MLGRGIAVCWMSAVVAIVAACGSEPPEAALRALIEDAEVAAEERDTGFFRGVLSERYADRRGNDRDRMIATLRGYFLTHQSIEMVMRIDSILLNGADAAEVVLHAGVVAHREGASLIGGLEGQLYRVELELVDEGGDWQVIGAHWEVSLE